jgi:hypothetical protein
MRLTGVPNSEAGYTAAMPRREDHEVHKDMWWHWTKKKHWNAMFIYFILNDQGKYEETKGTNRAEVHVLLPSDSQSFN